jgi:hypothetical protein
MQMLPGNLHVPKMIWRFDDGRAETRFNMPLNMTMKQPDS